MRIITLNTWGGKAGKDKILAFFEKYKDATDIFCLQEIWSAPYQWLEGVTTGGRKIKNEEVMTSGLHDIGRMLPEYQAFFHPHFGDHYGLLTLVHKKHPVMKEGEVFVYKHKGYVPDGDIGNHARNIQYLVVGSEKKRTTVINFHGLWNGKGKTDTEDRITQSQKIIEFTKTLDGEIVLCGDFNLLPDTQSIQLIEDGGFRNLIKEYDISSTRTSYYSKPERHADYMFVTKGLAVQNFSVLPDEVSDHHALVLDIQD